MLLQLCLVPQYLKFLGLDGYGIVGFYLALLAVAAVLDTAISSAVCREIAWLQARGDPDRRIPVFIFSAETSLWILVVALTALFLVFFSAFGNSWLPNPGRFKNQIQEIGWLMGGAFLTAFPAGFYGGILNGHQKQVQAGVLGALGQSLRGLGALAALVFVAADLRIFFLWNLVAGILITLMFRHAARGCWYLPQIQTAFSWQALSSIQGFAGGMFAITACSCLSIYADRLILSRYISLEEYGLYILICTVIGGMSRLVTPLTLYFTPLMTHYASAENKPEMLKAIEKFTVWTGVLLIPACVCFIYFSDTILKIWTGNRGLSSGTQSLSFFLGLGLILQSASYPTTTMLFAEKKIQGVLYGSLAMAILAPVGLILTAPHLGSLGASALLAALSFWYFVYIIFIGTKHFGKSLLYLPKTLFSFLALSIFFCWGGAQLFKASLSEEMALAGTITLTFLGVVVMARVIHPVMQRRPR